MNGLRSRVRIEADSKLMSGRDVAIAALLGAEEFGFGTGPLVAMGCVMMRVCNLDTCPMGICTQNPELRKRFKGKPEYIMNFMRFMAEDLREYMAKLGVRTVDELVGRTDLLKVKAAPAGSRAGEMDLTALLQQEGHTVTPGPWPGALVVEFAGSPAASAAFKKGLFHVQGLASQFAALCVDAQPGQQVLDLCAAPGGKATELNARLKGTGLLVANDISNARAKALLRNLELFGSENVLVTNETPAGLADVFPGFFDKILVDAPCSGEGMFRKDEAVIGTWTPERPDFFADLQREITSNAVKMLRPGGLMMYSTCTFAPQEDEGTVSFLLENFPEMELIEMEGYEGFSKGNPVWGNGDPEIEKTVRIWPHKMNGEGHYLALFRKKGEAIPYETEEKPIEKKNKKQKNRKKDRGTEAPGPSKAEKTDPFRFPVPDDSTDPGGGTGSPCRKSIPFPVPAGWRAESSFPAERSVSR